MAARNSWIRSTHAASASVAKAAADSAADADHARQDFVAWKCVPQPLIQKYPAAPMSDDAMTILAKDVTIREPSTPPIRRPSRNSSSPALMFAAIAVPSARPRKPMIEFSQRFRTRLGRS